MGIQTRSGYGIVRVLSHRAARDGKRLGAMTAALGLGVALSLPLIGMSSEAFAAPAHRAVAHPTAARSRDLARSADRPAAVRHIASRPAARPDVEQAGPAIRPEITCSDSWKTAASGAWNTASNWSTGVAPTTMDNACITVAGTYTVTISGSASAGTLTLGGTSGTQTVDVSGTSGVNSSLTLATTTGSDINAHGVFEIDSVSGGGYAEVYNNGTTGVTLTNNGTFETEGATSNPDYIEVNLTNDSGGKVTISGATTDQNDGTLTTNNGSFTVGATAGLALTGSSSFTQSAGTLTDTGAMTLSGGTFTQSGGTESAHAVGLFNGATLADSAGAGSFTIENTDTLSGTIPSSQTVTVVGASGVNSIATLTANVTNDGTLILDSVPSGGYAELYNNGTAGVTLTNKGTFEAEGATSNPDYIEANLTNDSGGTVTISGETTDQNDDTLTTNNGSFTITAATQSVPAGDLVLTSSSSFTQGAGTLADSGALTLSGGTFTQSGGTESANAVGLFNGAALADSAGAGSFTIENTDTVSGTIPSGQMVTVVGASGVNSNASLAGAGVTNDGTFVLDSVSGGGYADVIGGNLTNDGTFETEGATSNDDYIEANLINNGTVTLGGVSNDQDEGTLTTNNGSFTVGSSAGLALTGGSSFTQSAGTLTDTGAMTLSNGTFTQSGGTESANAVGLFNGSTLADSAGAGSFTIENTDTVSGTIPSGQMVTVVGAAGVNSIAALAGAGVTNDGTFVLDSESGGGYADVNGGPLTNDGTFVTEGATSNDDYIEANLINNGTVTLGGVSNDQDEGTLTTNNGSFTVGSSAGLALTGGSSFTQSAGTLTDTGAMTLSNGTFTQSGGTESANAVGLFNGSTLADSAGAGSFTIENTDTVSGTIPSGQMVTVVGAAGVNSIAALAGAGVTNDGTFVLDSESGGGYADVNGGPLTNDGTFVTEGATSNDDYIEANLINNGTVTIGGVSTKQDESTTTTNAGTLAVSDGDSMALTGGAVYTQTSTGTFQATVDASTGVSGLTGGTDTLAGTLAINTVGSPTLGNSYDVISGATSESGAFSAFSFGPHAYNVSYSSTAVIVTVETPFSLTGKNSHLDEDIPNSKIEVAVITPGNQGGPVYSATINWGDGTPPSAGTITGTKITGSHVYTTTGTFTVSTTVSDQLGTTRTITSSATVVVPPAPTVTAVSPADVVQGSSPTKPTKATLTLTGTEFTNNATVSFSETGITVTSTTWKSATTLSVGVSVASSAAPGAVNVTVTTVGGQGTCTGCLTIDAQPTVTSVSPPLVPGSATTVTVDGTGFQSGLTVTTNIAGATVGAPSSITATSFQVTITVPPGTAAKSTYDLTVTNPDHGKVTYKHLTVS